MKKLAIILLSLWAMSACSDDDDVIGIDGTIEENAKLITICCYDEGNEEWKTIKVDEVQLRRHLEHGDQMSPCTDSEPPSDMY